jgi:hypothetical protein
MAHHPDPLAGLPTLKKMLCTKWIVREKRINAGQFEPSLNTLPRCDHDPAPGMVDVLVDRTKTGSDTRFIWPIEPWRTCQSAFQLPQKDKESR